MILLKSSEWLNVPISLQKNVIVIWMSMKMRHSKKSLIKKKTLAHAYTCKHTYSPTHIYKTKNMARKIARIAASWTRSKLAWIIRNFRTHECRLLESWQMESGQKTQTEGIPKDKLSPAAGSVWPWPGLPAPFVEDAPARHSSEL